MTTSDEKPSDYDAECKRRDEALDAIEDRLFEIAVQIAVVKFDVNRTMTNYRAEIAAIDAARAKRLEEQRRDDHREVQDASRV